MKLAFPKGSAGMGEEIRERAECQIGLLGTLQHIKIVGRHSDTRGSSLSGFEFTSRSQSKIPHSSHIQGQKAKVFAQGLHLYSQDQGHFESA